LVEPEDYAIELFRYTYLNPVRANLVKKAEEYRWSSYRYYLDGSEKPAWLYINLVLSYFGKVKSQSIHQYCSFIQEAIGKKCDNPLNKVVGSILLGSEKFILELREKYIKHTELNRDISAIRSLKRRYSIEEIVNLIEKENGIDNKKLLKKIVIYISHNFGGIYLKKIGEYFGISESAVSQTSARVESKIRKDAGLKLIIEDIKKKIFS